VPKVVDAQGKVLREESIPEIFSGDRVGEHTVFRAVFRELANRRAGTASTKRRDEVRGGGRKPWKQKGTGRARQGSTRSPQWRHGGVVFGPKPRSFATSLNRRERRAALLAALADRYAIEAITLLDPAHLSVAKTRDFAAHILGGRAAGDAASRTLVVYAPSEHETIGLQLSRGGRNLRSVTVTSTAALDIAAILGNERLVLTLEAHAVLAALKVNP